MKRRTENPHVGSDVPGLGLTQFGGTLTVLCGSTFHMFLHWSSHPPRSSLPVCRFNLYIPPMCLYTTHYLGRISMAAYVCSGCCCGLKCPSLHLRSCPLSWTTSSLLWPASLIWSHVLTDCQGEILLHLSSYRKGAPHAWNNLLYPQFGKGGKYFVHLIVLLSCDIMAGLLCICFKYSIFWKDYRGWHQCWQWLGTNLLSLYSGL